MPSVDPMLAVGLDEEKVREVEADVRTGGGTPYVIPVGGSSGIGAIGYVAGTLELCSELDALGVTPSRLYFASGSRGTQAGLALGKHLCGADHELRGIAVSAGEPEKVERARRVVGDARARLGLGAAIDARDFTTDQDFIGDGYGIPTPAALEAMMLVARTEALVLDPTYTAKAMAALIQHVRDGAIPASESIVFLHTGGSPAIFSAAAVSALRAAPGWQVL